MSVLFDPYVTPTDIVYKNIRDFAKYERGKTYAEELWQNFKEYADTEFLSEIQRSFHQRYWEMYLGNALLSLGYKIRASEKNHGPDLLVISGGETVSVEAIAAKQGVGADAPADFGEGLVEVAPGWRMGAVEADSSEEGILLRYQNAIDGKFKKYQKYVADGKVGQNDPFVIALNGAGIPYDFVKDDPPRIIKALFGLGQEQVVFDVKKMEVIKVIFEIRREVLKKSGSPVSMDIFAHSSHEGISAVLYSVAHVINYPCTLGADFVLVHNPNAKNPLPHGYFKLGTEYWVEGDQLRSEKH